MSTDLQLEEFVRKSFPIVAVRITEKNMGAVAKWCDGTLKTLGEHDGRYGPFIEVNVLNPRYERQKQGFVGDWVLKMGSGFKVYTNRAFEMSFEKKQKPSPANLAKNRRNPDVTPEDTALDLTYGVVVGG